MFAFTQGFSDQGAAASTDHETKAAQDHDKGHNQIDSRKWDFSYEVGYK